MHNTGVNPAYRGGPDRRNMEQNTSEDAFWGDGASARIRNGGPPQNAQTYQN